MEFVEMLLEVLWRDIRFRGMELFVFALALTLASYPLALLASVLIHGTTSDAVWRGAWRGWVGGIVSWLLVLIGLRTYDSFNFPNITGYGLGLFLVCFLIGSCASLACSAFYFDRLQRQRFSAKSSPRRPVFSLRTFVIAQMLLAIFMGWWITTKRREIEMRIEQRHETAERHRQQTHQAECEARFRPYGWNTFLFPEHPQTSPHQLRLLLQFYDQPLSGFHDDVLKQITPAEHILHLEIKSEALTDEGLKTIGEFHTLERLKISSSQITDSGLSHLKRLSKLKELTVFSDQITDSGVAQLMQLPLERARFQSTELTQESLRHLTKIATLREGSIMDAQITPEQQQAFRESHPRTLIYAGQRRAVLPQRASLKAKPMDSVP